MEYQTPASISSGTARSRSLYHLRQTPLSTRITRGPRRPRRGTSPESTTMRRSRRGVAWRRTHLRRRRPEPHRMRQAAAGAGSRRVQRRDRGNRKPWRGTAWERRFGVGFRCGARLPFPLRVRCRRLRRPPSSSKARGPASFLCAGRVTPRLPRLSCPKRLQDDRHTGEPRSRLACARGRVSTNPSMATDPGLRSAFAPAAGGRGRRRCARTAPREENSCAEGFCRCGAILYPRLSRERRRFRLPLSVEARAQRPHSLPFSGRAEARMRAFSQSCSPATGKRARVLSFVFPPSVRRHGCRLPKERSRDDYVPEQ